MRLAFTLLLCSCLAASAAFATGGEQTVRHHRIAEAAPLTDLDRAQDAIAKQDLATARTLLDRYTKANAGDYRGWYTLGYVESATGDKQQAIAAYNQALTLKPDLFEANLNLGILLAAAKDNQGAIAHLRRATEETPVGADGAAAKVSLARAWYALGLAQASAGRSTDAQHAFREAARLDPQNTAYVQANSAAAKLDECGEHKIGETTFVHDCAAQSATLSTEQLEARVAANPADIAAASQLAHDYVDAKQYAKAEPLLSRALAAAPNDAASNYRYGFVLMQMKQWKPAEQYLARALNLDHNLKEAYGDLAVVAAENGDYMLSLQALDARAKFEPESAGSYFLRATNLDHLHDYPNASLNYRAFLDHSHGENPDNEWKARHRLIAIDPKYAKEHEKERR